MSFMKFAPIITEIVNLLNDSTKIGVTEQNSLIILPCFFPRCEAALVEKRNMVPELCFVTQPLERSLD